MEDGLDMATRKRLANRFKAEYAKASKKQKGGDPRPSCRRRDGKVHRPQTAVYFVNLSCAVELDVGGRG